MRCPSGIVIRRFSRFGARAEAAALVISILLLLGSASTALGGTVGMMLPYSASTSAGVYDSDDRLVRTLWSGRILSQGRIEVEWDGRDDDGIVVARAKTYRLRLLVHNVQYVWEGVIGNTSREFTGTHVHRALNPINDMAIDGHGHAFYVVGYNEQQSGVRGFSTADPQLSTVLAHDDYRRVFRFAATDGTLAYFANVGLDTTKGSFMREPSTFVMALRVADGTTYPFPAGHSDVPLGHPGNRWDSVIDDNNEDLDGEGGFLDAPSGLAVQQRADELFVAHQHLDEVRVFDKRSGAFLNRIKVSAPSALAIAPDDSLWVLCRADGQNAVVHYVKLNSHWTAMTRVSVGLRRPTAIGVSPLDGTLVVGDAGTEQLKAFDPAGRPRWIYGQLDGYRAGNPEVEPDKLWISAAPTYVAFQADGSFWFGDPGNARNLHLSADRKYIEQIMYLPKSYHIAVDPTHPTRVFDGYLEFAVDYSLPLRHSWRLVRNWSAGLGPSYVGELDGLRAVYTLANGRTYGVVPRFDLRASEVVELTSRGLRPTGARLALGEKLYPDGSLRIQSVRYTTAQIYVRRLVGFDPGGNLKWGDPEPLTGPLALETTDPYYHDVPTVGGVNEATFPQTSSGIVVFFNPSLDTGFHLGGVRAGDSKWLWRASPSGTWNVDSSGRIISPAGTYEIQRGVQYPGGSAFVSGRNVLYGYHGEAWNGGQANQWMHYLDNGLFVGQFGRPVYPAENKIAANAEAAGNAFSAEMVSVNDQLYLWHNDESVHGGVHRWRIDGANEIRFLEAAIEP